MNRAFNFVKVLLCDWWCVGHKIIEKLQNWWKKLYFLLSSLELEQIHNSVYTPLALTSLEFNRKHLNPTIMKCFFNEMTDKCSLRAIITQNLSFTYLEVVGMLMASNHLLAYVFETLVFCGNYFDDWIFQTEVMI